MERVTLHIEPGGTVVTSNGEQVEGVTGASLELEPRGIFTMTLTIRGTTDTGWYPAVPTKEVEAAVSGLQSIEEDLADRGS